MYHVCVFRFESCASRIIKKTSHVFPSCVSGKVIITSGKWWMGAMASRQKYHVTLHEFRLKLVTDSRNTFQITLSGGDVERRVSMHIDWGERAARVQHQLCYIHISCICRPVQTYIQLLRGKMGLFKVITWKIFMQLHSFCFCYHLKTHRKTQRSLWQKDRFDVTLQTSAFASGNLLYH